MIRLVKWLIAHNVLYELIDTNIHEIELIEKNTELRSNIWIFHLE